MDSAVTVQRVMLISGGTGGHVFPAFALASELVQQGHVVSFMTDRRGIKYLKDLPPQVRIKVLPLGSKPTSLILQPLFYLRLILCWVHALSFIMRQKPRKIVGYGGYSSLPGLLAGFILGKQLYASEQDAVLGSVNTLLAPLFRKIFLASPLYHNPSPAIARKCLLTGLPIRADIEQLQDRSYQMPEKGETIYLTILGGSQGAVIFSDIVPQSLRSLPASVRKKLRIFQQCRTVDVERVKAAYEELGIQATVSDFFTAMDQVLEKTHLIISRSGASSVAEIVAAGVPAIFVPYPYATHDHQTANARLLTDQGAGWLSSQQEFTVSRCSLMIQDLLAHPQKLLFASERLKLFSQKNVTRTLASHILSV